MGLFCLPKDESVEELVGCAINNLKLFLHQRKYKHTAPTYSNCDYPLDYLLQMVRGDVSIALSKYMEECHNNPLINPEKKNK